MDSEDILMGTDLTGTDAGRGGFQFPTQNRWFRQVAAP
jgi:hypothetical protein